MRDHQEHVWYVCFYTTRSETGTPQQMWAPSVYLTDHWEVFETRQDAINRYDALVDKDETHSIGIAPVDQEYKTDWM